MTDPMNLASRLAQAEEKGRMLCGQNGNLLMQIAENRTSYDATLAAAQARIAELEQEAAERAHETKASVVVYSEEILALKARYQRLVDACEWLIKDLQTSAARCKDDGWKQEAFAYNKAAEWAQAALEKGRGGG